MVFREILEDVLFLMRVGSNPDVFTQVKDAFTPANTHPTSGDSGTGTAFGATAPDDPKLEAKLWERARRRDEPPNFSGL